MLLLFFLFGLILSPAGSLPFLTTDEDYPTRMFFSREIHKDSFRRLDEVKISDLTELTDAKPVVLIDEREASSGMKLDLQNEEFTSIYDNETTEEALLKVFTTTPNSILEEADSVDYELMVKKILKVVIDEVDNFINKSKPYETILDFSKISMVIDTSANGEFIGVDHISDPELMDYIYRNTDSYRYTQRETMKPVVSVSKTRGKWESFMRVLRDFKKPPTHGNLNFMIGFNVPFFEINETVPVNVNSPSEAKLDSNNVSTPDPSDEVYPNLLWWHRK